MQATIKIKRKKPNTSAAKPPYSIAGPQTNHHGRLGATVYCNTRSATVNSKTAKNEQPPRTVTSLVVELVIKNSFRGCRDAPTYCLREDKQCKQKLRLPQP